MEPEIVNRKSNFNPNGVMRVNSTKKIATLPVADVDKLYATMKSIGENGPAKLSSNELGTYANNLSLTSAKKRTLVKPEEGNRGGYASSVVLIVVGLTILSAAIFLTIKSILNM